MPLNSPASPTEPAGTRVRGVGTPRHVEPRVAADEVGEAGREPAKPTRHGSPGVGGDDLVGSTGR